MGPLQHLHVALIDFKCGAESDGQTGQYVAALHEQKGLPINFLMEMENIFRNTILLNSSKCIQAKIFLSVYQVGVRRNLS